MTKKSVIVMGVAGCGKSSLGMLLAQRIGVGYVEGDDYHNPASREKMHQGIPLTDADRDGWLETLGGLLRKFPGGAVLTCSALKRAYRDRLRAAAPGVGFVYLEISSAEALRRVEARGGGHFFPAGLVDSQFAALESPVGETDVLALDGTHPLRELAERALVWLDEREKNGVIR
ncbi:MAG: gluconokinase [Propionivibrio sp.]